jgi:putative MATE family efflux protein
VPATGAVPPRPGRLGRYDRSIVEGPIRRVVWRLAWPAIVQNALGGLQGLVDHAMVGNFVGYTGNAAIGVSWQIFLVVIVFMSSLFTGMAVLVARFAGANEPEKVNRVVYQAFLVALALAVLVLAPLGYFLSPYLLDLVNAAPEVKREALPYIRTLFVFGLGLLLFFMFSGALRAAGDVRTPMRFGLWITVLNVVFNVVLIRGLGPIPALGTRGAALGTVLASSIGSGAALWMLLNDRLVVGFSRSSYAPDWGIIRSLFRFGLPAGIQGVAMNVAGLMLLRFIGSLEHSAAAQAAYAVGYTELFSLVSWTSVGLMGAASVAAGQNLGAGRPERSVRCVHAAAGYGLLIAACVSVLFVSIPEQLVGVFGLTDPIVVGISRQLLGYLAISAFFITVALGEGRGDLHNAECTMHNAECRMHGGSGPGPRAVSPEP